MNPLSPKNLASEFLAPLQLYVEANRYGVSDIAERANRIGGCSLVRQHIQQYFHRDPAKRSEPKLGNGLLLSMVQRELQGEGVLVRVGNRWKVRLDKLSKEK